MYILYHSNNYLVMVTISGKTMGLFIMGYLSIKLTTSLFQPLTSHEFTRAFTTPTHQSFPHPPSTRSSPPDQRLTNSTGRTLPASNFNLQITPS